MTLRSLVLALLTVGTLLVGAARADFVCRAEVDRSTVPQGGNLVLTVSAEGDVGWSADFALPDIPETRISAGGTSQSMTLVNGATRTSVSRTWYLLVDTPDDFTIGPVTVRTEGGQCQTKPIKIRVTAPLPPKTVPPADSGNRLPEPGGDQGAGGQGGKPGDDIFLTLEVDKDEVFVGEQIILTFRYWRRVQPWNNPSYTAPRTEGFWREDLGSEKNYRRAVQGRSYTVTEIKYGLFPTRGGTLTIEPAELSFPDGVFDRFFNSRRSNRGPHVLRTRSIPVQVRELPRPRPEGFSQIVASGLQLRAFVDRDSVPRGEAVGLKIHLVADGFLKGFSGLELQEPAGSRMHDAAESFESRPESGRIVGRMSVEKVIIPSEEGVLVIPEVAVPWFNTSQSRYEVARTPELRVAVTPSDLPLAGEESSGFLRNEISRLGEDLAFIHQVPRRLSRGWEPFTGTPLWWVLLLLPVLLLGGTRLYLDRVSADRRDPAGRRRRLALARAQAGLAHARQQEASSDRCESVAKVIMHYIADCTDRPAAGVTASEVQEYCGTMEMAEAGERLSAILDSCDHARFGGLKGNNDSTLTSEVQELVEALEKARKDRKARGGTGMGPVATIVALGAMLLALQVPAVAQVPTGDSRPGADPVRLVAESNQAYTEGRLDSALEGYLQARALGVNDPVLHFNLGNTYARRGQLGEAVASYLRARRLAPRDQDIARNLTWVRRNIKDLELTENELPLFIAQIAGLVRAFTLDQWGWALIFSAWLAAGLVGVGWYRESFGTRLRRFLLAAAVLVLVAAVITAGRWYREEVRDVAVVVVPEAEVKSGPADNFPVLFQVHDGLTVTIDSAREGWVRIGMGGEWRGWLPADTVTRIRLDDSPGKP